MANTILTISIESSYIRMAEVSSKGGITVNKIARVKTPEGCIQDDIITDYKALADVINEKVTAKGILTKDVVFSVFSTKIAIKEISTPVLSDKKLAEYIESNATEFYPVDINDYILAHNVLETVTENGEKNMRVLLMAAPKDMITPYYQIAAENGYNIQTIDYFGNSALQVLQKHVDKGVNLTIQLMEDSTIVNIIKNNVLQLHRVIPYGRDVLTETLMDMRGITEEEATELLCTEQYVHPSFDGDMITNSLRYLVNNISRVMDYYASRNPENPIEKAYYIGDNIIGLDELFASEFNFSVKVIKKMKNVKTADLSMEPNKLVNYIGCIGSIVAPADFVTMEKKAKQASASNIKLIGLGVLVAAVVCVGLLAKPVIDSINYKKDKADLEKKISAISDVETLVSNYYNITDMATDAKTFAALTRGNNDVLLNFLIELEKKLPSDISITTMTINEGAVTISAKTSIKPTMATFISQLKGIDNVTSVAVSNFNEKKDVYGGITTTFSATCFFYNDESIGQFAGVEEKETEEDAENNDEE
ncbi:MAG: pilus assembly protein PilM [Lachnospiraceae bacterium]|nr:pilus assembly protein PilM [Lachnospiraceae bacterium]